MEDQITWQDLDSSFGRMCQGLFQATGAETSKPSSRRLSASQSRKRPMCLCLKRAGRSPDASTMTWEDGLLLGEYTMPSTGESPREENASLLSQFLEDSPHPKYFLSERACAGILNRAERRGKKLPPELESALLAQSRSRSEAENLGGGKERTGALSTLNNQSVLPCSGFDYKQGAKAGSIGFQTEQAPTLNAAKQMAVFDARGNGDGAGDCTITGDHQSRVTDYTALVSCYATQGFGRHRKDDLANSFKAGDYKRITELVAVGIDSECNAYREQFRAHCSGGAEEKVYANDYVRRLTPMECERLQGYPDGWTDIGPWTDSKGKTHKESSDSARYKALGNSIALPFWFYLLRRISAQYERPATLGSLFDGIGGFPLCWEKCNGEGTALWASEIEEFPMAVTKVRFNDQ